ncbi:MAG: hypothetical protein LBR10_15000 [Prevotellaceae bacterium]|jgi:uncharacterized integral membrane protein|nr:hypothetical protein [Prevotellaceae bacterium]
MNDFFARIYELGNVFFMEGFSEDLYDNSLYLPVGLVMLISSFIGMLIYYYAIPNPKYDRWYHWFGLIALIAVINAVYAYWTVGSELDIIYAQADSVVPYSIEFFNFATVDFLWTLIACFAVSMIIKWKSKNFRKTPF